MPNLYIVFVLAVTALMLTPGPNVALIVANSVTYGARSGLMTVVGTTAAVVVHLVFVGVGLAEGLRAIGVLFEWVRWGGVAYLVVLGVRTWGAVPADLGAVVPVRRGWAMVGRAALVSLTNPKTLLFYGAFFPQFVAPERPIGPQVWVLCVTFIVVGAVVDSGWALLASQLRGWLATRGRLRQRVSGGVLVTAGVGLAFARPG